MYMNDPTLGRRLKDKAPTRRRLETMLLDNISAYQTDFGRLLLSADPPALHVLPAVHAPTLIVSGDTVNPDLRIIMSMLQRGVHDARQITIPHTGHLANIENPASSTASCWSGCRSNQSENDDTKSMLRTYPSTSQECHSEPSTRRRISR
jgi:pimeloyl-ACP methyl ester carboxylesterase